MKKATSQVSGSPKSQPARHQFEHEVPTHIHNPEEDMMVLARWFHRALQNPAKFWGTVAAITGGILALVLLLNMVSWGSSSASEVWSRLSSAKDPADRVVLAEDFPQTPAASWARLQAAVEYYDRGLQDLPRNRDVALPTLKKALDNFDAVIKSSPAGSPQARAGSLGKARTLEARNELPKAIEQYQLVAKTWPGTAEAAEATAQANALSKPEAQEFYKDLYAYTPPNVTLPPLGSQSLDMPLLPAPPTGVLPAEASPNGIPSTIPLLPPPPPVSIEVEKGKTDTAKPEAKPEASKTEGNKPDTAKPETKPDAAKPDAAKPETKPAAPAAEKPKS